MSRNAAAYELASIIKQIQVASQNGERLAAASGGQVEPKYFRAIHAAAVMAAGELDQKGLLIEPAEESTAA